MDALKKTVTSDTTAIFTTDGDLFRYLKSAGPASSGSKPDVLRSLQGLPSLLDVK